MPSTRYAGDREKYKKQVGDLSDDALVDELLRVFYRNSSAESDPRTGLRWGDVKLILKKEFMDRYAREIEKAAYRCEYSGLYFDEGWKLRKNDVHSFVLTYLLAEGDVPWDTLPSYDPDEDGDFEGWLREVAKNYLSEHSRQLKANLGHINQPYAKDPSRVEEQFPDDEVRQRKVKTEGSVHGAPTAPDAQAASGELWKLAKERLEDHLPQDYDPEEALDLVSKVLGAILEKEDLSESEDGVSYARVVQRVYIDEGDTSSLYDVLYEELQEKYGEGFVQRNTLTNWGKRGRENFRERLQEKYPDLTKLMFDVVLDRKE